MLRKITGGRVEGLFLSEIEPGRWRVLLRNLGGYHGNELRFENEPERGGWVTSIGEDGECELRLLTPEPAAAVLDRVGRVPLPPYIRATRSAIRGTRPTATGIRPFSPAPGRRSRRRRRRCISQRSCSKS